jgi:hypothetical protein
MTQVFFSLLDDEPPSPRDRDYLSFVQQECGADERGDLALCTDCEQADIIVILENADFKWQSYLKRLQKSSLLANFPQKTFTLNYEDKPSGALTGLYSSLMPDQYCPEIHRSWPHVCLPNEKIYSRPVTDIDSARFLFSFRGNLSSHPLRSKLGRLYGSPSELYQVEGIDRWYNHSVAEKESYLALIENSLFSLCPRGIAPYSHRIGEVMALGRVPVIIADEWIPFCFEEADPYYIRIAEADLPRIADILRERRGEARTLAANVRKLFQRYLSVGNRFREAVRMMQKLQADRPSDWHQKFYANRWSSRKFWQVNGWTLEQRVLRKIKKWRGSTRA